MKRWMFIGIVLATLLGYLVGSRCHRISPGEPPETRVDTLFIRDTFMVTEPKYITRMVVDSVPYPVTDTIRMQDTLFVLLERQQVTWEDSLSRVYASGVDPQVDSVLHFVQERVITRHIPIIQVRKTRWGVGIQAGATADKNGVIPYVGVGLSYNIISW